MTVTPKIVPTVEGDALEREQEPLKYAQRYAQRLANRCGYCIKDQKLPRSTGPLNYYYCSVCGAAFGGE